MPFLSQNRFPWLWNIFQYTVGGTIDKRRLCLKHYQGEKRILEVGCSLGNISKAFTRFPGISFTGLDIDPVVIALARKHFRHAAGFNFVCQDLRELAETAEYYDYIFFSGVCHHIDRQECHELLSVASKILAKADGHLVVVDPLLPQSKDPWLVRKYIRLEQGQYLRSDKQMINLLQDIDGVRLIEKNQYLIGASPLHLPICARFGVYLLRS